MSRARRSSTGGACWTEIAPLPAMVGWDTIDVMRARRAGWRTRASRCPTAIRCTCARWARRDGLLRAYRRWGRCAWSFGEHPLHVLAIAVQRAGDRPPLLGGVNYVLGWAMAAVTRAPRAEPELLEYVRDDTLRRVRRRAVRTRPVDRSAAGSADRLSLARGRPVPQRGRAPGDVPGLDRRAGAAARPPAARRRRLDRRLVRARDAVRGGAGLRRRAATPPRRPERDRLVAAQEFRAFEWGLGQADRDWDVVAKLDADLRLPPDSFAEIERELLADPSLGIAGAYVSQSTRAGRWSASAARPTTSRARRSSIAAPAWRRSSRSGDRRLGDHRRGACADARLAHGELPARGGDPIHLRRIGSHDGVLRGYGAWASPRGARRPSAARAGRGGSPDVRPPAVLCGAAYLAGYVRAAAPERRGASPSCAPTSAAPSCAACAARPCWNQGRGA